MTDEAPLEDGPEILPPSAEEPPEVLYHYTTARRGHRDTRLRSNGSPTVKSC